MADQADAMLMAATASNPWMAGLSAVSGLGGAAPSSATSSSGDALDEFLSGEVTQGGGVHIGAEGVNLNSPLVWAVGALLAVVVLQAAKK